MIDFGVQRQSQFDLCLTIKNMIICSLNRMTLENKDLLNAWDCFWWWILSLIHLSCWFCKIMQHLRPLSQKVSSSQKKSMNDSKTYILRIISLSISSPQPCQGNICVEKAYEDERALGQIARNQQWKAWPTDQTITPSNFNFSRLCQVMATHKIAIISLILWKGTDGVCVQTTCCIKLTGNKCSNVRAPGGWGG